MGTLHMNDQNEAHELLAFQLFYSKRRMITTWVLAFLIITIFLFEELLGGSTTVSVLVKMGANVRELVKEGQYFRLLTSVFLHAGWLHVFVNVYVLFALGGFFNRILGDSKYLTVLLISGITGSFASYFLGHSQVSVGASGALWGLFGASIVIAFFRTNLIPETVRLRLRRVTLINLILNLGVSFLPMVDFWAHIGGGIGGFLCSLLFVYEPTKESTRRILSYSFHLLAVLLALLYGAGFAQMLVTDKPWVKGLSSPVAEVEFGNIPFTLSLPQDLKQVASPDNSASKSTYLFGDLRYEPIAIEVSFILAKELGAEGREAWLSRQRDSLLKDPSVNADIRKSVDLRTIDERRVLFFETPSGADVMGYNYVLIEDTYVIKLVFITSKKTPQKDVEALAKKIVGSIKNRDVRA